MAKNKTDSSRVSISEIFLSLQGEGSRSGEPCIFVRLAGCTLGCRWCDTRTARDAHQGKILSLEEILMRVGKYRPVRSVLLTGGEPLEQKSALKRLITRLLKKGYEVFIETNGAEPVSGLPRSAVLIMDVKTPSSGVSDRNLRSNLGRLKTRDEVKFVIADRKDFVWAVRFVRRHNLSGRKVFFSAVEGRLRPAVLSRWILAARVPVRLMLRLHRILGMK